MKSAMRCLLALAVVQALSSQAAAISPVQKVLQMMSEMKTKGEKMMAEEQQTYRAYSEWVDDQSRELGFEMKTAKSDIEKLTAEATKADSDVSELSDAINQLQSDLANTEAEKQEATDIRNSQHA